ncbi:MAG: hypothetical protein CMF45_08735 [Legionellales bacterium]|nr:hypothetical protein [Legionellales bacterium]|tara:strand:+ start:171 stop:356 length:186 start_codon:yes stop_codon:yes gene_type:complete
MYEGLSYNEIALQKEQELERQQSYKITRHSWGVYKVHTAEGEWVDTVGSEEEAQEVIKNHR